MLFGRCTSGKFALGSLLYRGSWGALAIRRFLAKEAVQEVKVPTFETGNTDNFPCLSRRVSSCCSQSGVCVLSVQHYNL